MRKLLIVFILAIVLMPIAHADTLVIPYSCYPKEVQAWFAEEGFIIDLTPVDRTAESFGWIDFENSNTRINTYRGVADEELDKLLKVIVKHLPRLKEVSGDK